MAIFLGDLQASDDDVNYALIVGSKESIETIQSHFSSESFDVDTATSSVAAIDKISDTGYDVILATTDVDALDIAANAGDRDRIPAPVVILSREDGQQHPIEALNRGATGYIRRGKDEDWIDASVIERVTELATEHRNQTQRIDRDSNYRQMLSNLSEGYYRTNTEGVLVWTTPPVADILGYDSPEELLGTKLASLYPDDIDETIRTIVEANGGTVEAVEVALEHADGSKVDIQTSSQLVTQDNTKIGMEGTIRDITGKKRCRQELARQDEQLDQCASMINHDLSNPLGIAQTYLDFARDTADEDDFDAVAEALEEMDAMIDEICTFARTGRSVDETVDTALSELVTKAWDSMEEDTATMTVETDGTVSVHPDRFQHVFTKLFENSIEHNEQPVTIRVGMTDTEIYVADDGAGIPEADRSDIFDRGFTTDDDASGYGLSIVDSIVQAHGFSVSVTDSKEGGTRIAITGVA